MKKKNDPNQLWLNFNTAVDEFRTASTNLANAAEALVKEQPAAKKEVAAILSAERTKVNDLVHLHARHKNLHYREVWNVLYARLREKTGFDAIVRGVAQNIIPLEAVCRAGKLPKLLKIAASL